MNQSTETVPQEDHTLARDSRVLPVVKKLLAGLGTFPLEFNRTRTADGLKKEQDSFASFVRTIFFPAAFDHDLRQKDVVYTFQLSGLAIEMLRNRAMTPKDEAAQHLSDCALAILKELGEVETLRLSFREDELSGDVAGAGQARADLYEKLYYEIVEPKFVEFNVQRNEINHVFEIMAELNKSIGTMVEQTVADARTVAERKMWGIEDVDTLTILAIHKQVASEAKDGVY